MNFTVTVLTTLATTAATVANAHAATTAPVDVPQPMQLDFVDGDALSRLDDNDYARAVAAKPLADAAKEQLRAKAPCHNPERVKSCPTRCQSTYST
uniref:Secreted protein n=1 Tax=Globodera pallida TaxID=36090 RepID=A0A183CNX0_GLOPA